MATIILRGVVNRALTIPEVDGNFKNINDDLALKAYSTDVALAISNATPNFSTLTGKPTTVAGYGITDIGDTYAPLIDPTFTGTVTAQDFNALSDISLKTNILPIVDSISIVNKLQGVSFDWKDDNRHSFGFIAQEVEKVLPEIVSTGDSGIKSVKYLHIIALLLEAIKEQEVRITQIEGKL